MNAVISDRRSPVVGWRTPRERCLISASDCSDCSWGARQSSRRSCRRCNRGVDISKRSVIVAERGNGKGVAGAVGQSRDCAVVLSAAP